MTNVPPTTPPPPAPVVSNPLTWLFDFIGSANVQKALGLSGSAIAALTAADGKSIAVKISGMSLGAAFALGVHVVDAARAKIGR